MTENRNLMLFAVLAALVLFGWPLVMKRFQPANPPATRIEAGRQVALPNPAADPAADGPRAVRDRALVLAESPRVAIRTPRLSGSIALRGARIDDLVLVTYRETIARNAPPIRLLTPAGTSDAYYAGFGWSGEGVALPGPDTLWTADGTVLAPGRPVTLSWDNGAGQRFRLRYEIDDRYMFTVTQEVVNGGTAPIAVRANGAIARTGISKDPDTWTMHTGPIGTFDGATDYSVDFKDLDAGGSRFATTGGWLGFGDKYWLTALVPDQRVPVDAGFFGEGQNYRAAFTDRAATIQPGRTARADARFFAGAKEVALLDDYETTLGIANFGRAIDWGWFEIVEKPIFKLLDFLFKFVGNFGVAIMLLTCIIRALMFPIANKQFASMAGMRVVQPKMKALQEQYKDDKEMLQKKMLELYREEKVNPVAGCLPILIQIPIFYALYKVLMLSIEMRHQPFALWIRDLSAPDPLTPVNLFGLLAFTPPPMLHLGVLAIVLGITMWMQFKLNPPPADPVQQQIFSIMPWIMMFVFAPFAAGLQLYYVANNLLSIAQQKFLYSRHPALKQAPST